MGPRHTERPKGVGDRIRLARQRIEITQAELARRVGRDQTSISNFETGKILPSTDTLQRIGLATDATVEWLLHGSASVPGDLEQLIIRLLEAFGPAGMAELGRASDEDLRRLARLWLAMQRAD